MKILLDEGVPRVIQKRLSHLPIVTVEEMGWRGIKNGHLLERMTGTCSILVTTDKNLRYQQNLEKRQIATVILPTNQIPLVVALLPHIEHVLATIRPGAFTEIPLPDTE
ncbi:MAG: hypothetical protein NVS2B7_38720 [Herpetosiphon sp.]